MSESPSQQQSIEQGQAEAALDYAVAASMAAAPPVKKARKPHVMTDARKASLAKAQQAKALKKQAEAFAILDDPESFGKVMDKIKSNISVWEKSMTDKKNTPVAVESSKQAVEETPTAPKKVAKERVSPATPNPLLVAESLGVSPVKKQKKYKAPKKKVVAVEESEAEEEEEVVAPPPKKQKKKRKVVEESEDEDEESEEEVAPPPKKQKKKAKKPLVASKFIDDAAEESDAEESEEEAPPPKKKYSAPKRFQAPDQSNMMARMIASQILGRRF